MIKKHWLWTLLCLVALAFFLTGLACGRQETMLVLTPGQVFPSPSNGETLTFRNQNNGLVRVRWIGDPETAISPCTQQQPPYAADTASATCTINYPTKQINYYHYICVDPPFCSDPTVPGPRSGGGTKSELLWKLWRLFHLEDSAKVVGLDGGSAARASGPPISAKAVPSGQSSNVWYFAPDGGGISPTYPIQASTYSAAPGKPQRYDQVLWEPVGDARWQVAVMPDTCKEGTPGQPTRFPDAEGNSVCTVQQGAQSQNYCVVYRGTKPGDPVLTAGTALLLVTDPNGNINGTNPPNNAPPTCALP